MQTFLGVAASRQKVEASKLHPLGGAVNVYTLSLLLFFLYIERKTILFFLIFQSLAMDDWIRKEITHSSPVI